MYEKITSKERFLKALKLEIPDKVPTFDFFMSPIIWKKIIGFEPTYTAKEQLAAALILGVDAVSLPTNPASNYKMQFIREDVYKDEWGGIRKKDPAAWPDDAPIDFILKDETDLKNLKRPDPDRPERYEEIIETVELNKGRIALGGVVDGPMTKAWYLHGADRIMWNVKDNPKFLKEIFKVMNEFSIPHGINQIKAGVDYMWVAEDLGYSSGPFFSRDTFLFFIFPFLEDIVKQLRRVKKDLLIAFHCCGDFKIFIEDLIGLGIQALNPFQRTAGWDIKEVKEKYGRRICIIGNIDSSRTLPYGTAEDVEREVKETIKIAGKKGGLVISSDHSLHDGIPMENIFAMYNAVEKYGFY